MKLENGVIAPTINLNGSDSARLAHQVDGVLHACTTLQEALAAAYPHGRDYQHDPSGEEWKVARAQFEARAILIRDIADEYRAIGRSIADQQHARLRQRSP